MNDMTFHAKLIIDNDQDCNCEIACIVTHVMNHVYHDSNGQAYSDQRRARIYVLSQFLRCYIEELTDAGNEYRGYNQMTSELILGAIQEVNFREIAEDLIGDYSPKPAEEVAEREEYFNIRGFANYDIDED